MARTIVFIVLILFIGGCVGGYTPVSDSEKIVRATAKMPLQPETLLLTDTGIWMEKHFTDEAEPILYRDLIAGVIVGHGQIAYPCSWLSCTTKGDWRVAFEMSVRMQAAKTETTFRKLMLISPSSDNRSGMVGPVWSQRDMDSIRPKLMNLHQDLIRYLNRSR